MAKTTYMLKTVVETLTSGWDSEGDERVVSVEYVVAETFEEACEKLNVEFRDTVSFHT